MFGWFKKKKVVQLTMEQQQKILEVYDYEARFSTSKRNIVDKISKFLGINAEQVEKFLIHKRNIKMDE